MKKLIWLLIPFTAFGQTPVGPRNPSTGTNITGIGTSAWSAPGNIIASDNTYATIAASNASSNYLQGTNFGFTLLNTDVIAGIQLEVEKNQVANPVTLLSGWTIGNTGAPIVPGLNRILIVSIGFENLVPLDLTNVTFGGVPMTFLAESTVTGAFMGETNVWYLKESQLAAISGTAISITYAGVKNQHFDIIGSALYGNVDQSLTFVSDVENAVTTAGATTLMPALTVSEGSMSVYSLFAGTPPPGTVMGPSNIMTINSSFVKQFEFASYSTSTPGFETAGGLFFIAEKLEVAAGTESPTSNHTGGHNRRLIVVFNLRRARNMDNSVRLRKSTGYVGSDNALTTTDWQSTDSYTTYGSNSNLWGTSWTFSEINDPNFGAGISAFMQNNGPVRVDHMRITVYKTSVLPVELISFASSVRESSVVLNWVTASEKNVDSFVVERSTDGFEFAPIGYELSAGDTDKSRYYELPDTRPVNGTNYYRLKTIDKDGSSEYSDIVAEVFDGNKGLTVYPNPTSGWAKVLSDSEIDEVTVVDVRGKVLQLLSGSGENNSEDIDLSAYEDGIYYICIRSKGETTIKELVKVSREAGEIH